MEDISLGEMLAGTCRRFPSRTAIIYEDMRISYDALERSVNALGNRLKSLGIKKGDKVAIMLSNIPEFVISYFAALKLGAVAVTINTLSTTYELQYLLGNSDSKVFITVPSSVRRFEEIRGELPLCRHLIVTEGKDGDASIEETIKEGPYELEVLPISGDDPAAMIYTSGLTGKARGAVLTHRNLATQSRLLEDICHGTEADRGFCLIPLFHSFGASVNMLMIIRAGASVVMMDHFNIESIFKSIERERVTYIAAVPRLFLGMLLYEDAKNYDLSSLRFCITGGSKMPPEYIPTFSDSFGTLLVEGYGLTEASPVCSVNRIDMEQKLGSIGIPIPEVEAKIFDDEGNELPTGETGELVIRGPNIMKGYYKDEDATAEVIKAGWLFTGDLASIDEDGYIFITGLKKRMIITSGYNVYPREVEGIIDIHPAVKSSRVMGKSDLMRGEIVKALIVKGDNADADEKDIIRHCRQYLSPYKCPREVEFVEKMP
ncbi:MAG: AMP-binding protein [Thermodesulfobacteriota bacterium]|nr:AMP-binding protein [Thermodesulfobacteriota bacterium]